MPGFDGTGPNGMGSMTGGGRGRCGGRGHRHWFYATGLPGWMRTDVGTDDSQENVEMLKIRAAMLENEIKLVNERIKSLENKGSK
jgi:hypothetical protein